ncbi:hypothetical protein TNCV_2301681 [Trichonephila clavipes]|nr:hypothetical protein TNCV_2301681 [Trichonephila clavipes]
MTTSRYLLPDAVLGRGPRISKAIRSKGAPTLAMQLPQLRIFGPFRAEQASQDLQIHCSTSASLYPSRIALELGAKFS